ncbi:MAG: outer membrane beta-barrel protein [Rickettsiales bacterium]|jgi:opacity protein-like surface antigen|nr:outer membrane beta-barrel protein [Rickettsiales bacterium]
MNRKIKLFALCSLPFALCTISPARADIVDLYAGASAGIGTAHFHDQNYSMASYGAVFGIDIPVFRAELEYNFLSGDRGTGDINAHAAMLNAYAKLLPTPVIKPYIGAGIGYVLGGQVSDGKSGNNDINSSLAYQGMVGLQFDLTVIPIIFDIEGRIMHVADIFPDNDLTHFDARLKARYVF